MDARTDAPNRSHSNIDVQSILTIRLDKLTQDYPEHFSKPFYVLTTVDGNVDGQLKERLIEAKTNATEERMTLIPYVVANSHWIGLVIKYNTNQEIERAEFIDPVMYSHFDTEKLQNLFTEIFPNTFLRSRPVQYRSDRISSGLALIRNLIRAIVSFELGQIKLPDDWYFPFPGNENKLRKLRQELNDGLIKLKIPDIGILQGRIEKTLERIKHFEKDKEMDSSDTEKST